MTTKPILYLFWILTCPAFFIGCNPNNDWTTHACPISHPTPPTNHHFIKLKEILSQNILYSLQSTMHLHTHQKVLQTPSSTPSFSQNAPHPPCIDINKDDIQQLTRLPGIGQTKAQNIIQMRLKKPFKRKKDIQKIKGIGAKTYQKLAPMLCDI